MDTDDVVAFQSRLASKRNADRERELERLKSRGVVSVLNKAFDSHGNVIEVVSPAPSTSTPTTSPSSSSSGGTSNSSRMMPRQRSLDQQEWQNFTSTVLPGVGQPPTTTTVLAEPGTPAAESIGSHANHLEKHTMDTIQHYIQQKEAETAKVHQLAQIIVKQDRLIFDLEAALAVKSAPPKEEKPSDEQHMLLLQVHEQLTGLEQQKVDYEAKIADLQAMLCQSEQHAEQMATELERVTQQCKDQQFLIDSKMEKLTRQLFAQQPLPPLPPSLPAPLSASTSTSSAASSRSARSYASAMPPQLHPPPPTHQLHQLPLAPPSMPLPPVPIVQQHDFLRDPARDSMMTVQSQSSMASFTSNDTTSRYSRVTLPRRSTKHDAKAAAHVLSWPNASSEPPLPFMAPIGPPPTCPLPPVPPMLADDGQIDDILSPHTPRASKTASVLYDNDIVSPLDRNPRRSQQPIVYESDDDERIDPGLVLDPVKPANHDHPGENDIMARRKVSSTLELLLMATPTTDSLLNAAAAAAEKHDDDDDIRKDESYIAFAEQLQARLSISREIDQLHQWDREILEQIRRYASNKNKSTSSVSLASTPSMHNDEDNDNDNKHHHAKNTPHASKSTPHLSTNAPDRRPSTASSKQSNQPSHTSSSSGNNTNANAFWKGMKKKLRV
ncbi:hypothetical protein BC940DRAFT_288716 [Gongronella butleri]|nr:hypothetical protein BC940DRAFT_288716 [Gongronella butleri]